MYLELDTFTTLGSFDKGQSFFHIPLLELSLQPLRLTLQPAQSTPASVTQEVSHVTLPVSMSFLSKKEPFYQTHIIKVSHSNLLYRSALQLEADRRKAVMLCCADLDGTKGDDSNQPKLARKEADQLQYSSGPGCIMGW